MKLKDAIRRNPNVPRGQYGMRINFERERYRHIPWEERRRAVLMPTLMHTALAEVCKVHHDMVREDILNHLSRAAHTPIRDVWPVKRRMRVIEEARKVALEMLHAMGTGDPREAAIVCAWILWHLSTHNQFPANDVRGEAMMAAILVLHEASEAPEVSRWPQMTGKRVNQLGGRAINRAEAMGAPVLGVQNARTPTIEDLAVKG